MSLSFSLSLAAVDILIEDRALGRTPFPFQVPHIGTSYTQRAQVREAVFRDLESRGLMREGVLDTDTELALRTWTHAPIAIAAAAQLDDGGRLFARAGTDGQCAVVGRQDGNMLVFEEARPTGLVPAIVDLLPLTPAAPGHSVTIAKPGPTRGQHQSRGDGYDPFVGVAPPRAPSSSQTRMVQRIFDKPKRRIGQFTSFVTGNDGKSVALGPLAWFDNEDGRYFSVLREASDGQHWITYAPADNARIAQHLHAELEEYQ